MKNTVWGLLAGKVANRTLLHECGLRGLNAKELASIQEETKSRKHMALFAQSLRTEKIRGNQEVSHVA